MEVKSTWESVSGLTAVKHLCFQTFLQIMSIYKTRMYLDH